jgi:hypothetical protein
MRPKLEVVGKSGKMLILDAVQTRNSRAESWIAWKPADDSLGSGQHAGEGLFH